MEELQIAIQRMINKIAEILAPCMPSIYLHGSVVADDFRLGWSDIVILVLTESQITEQQAKIIVNDAEPIGIVTLGLWENFFTISELIIRPDRRGKQFGSSALTELIAHSKDIIGVEIQEAKAVIFPNNIPSQKAFEKAGFAFHYEHPDGDAWYYRYQKA